MRHIDVRLEDDLYERVSAEAEKRGATLTGYIRHVVLDSLQHRRMAADGDGGAAVARLEGELSSLRERLEELERRVGETWGLAESSVRALVVVVAAVAATVHGDPQEKRDSLVRQALALYDRLRGVQVDERREPR